MTSDDVVLLLVGTNNVIAGDSAETMLAKADVLLDRIVNHASSPDVRLMKLQPVGGDWWEDGDASRTNNDTIRIFNTGLDQLVSQKYADRGIQVVDSDAALADLRNDGVHLTEAAYRKTAGAWYNSLEGEFDFLPSRPTLPGSNAVASAVWTKEWFGGAKPDKYTGTGFNEYINGGANGDTMTGKGGDDTYVVGQNNDRVVEELGGGVDSVLTTLTNYAAPAQVETVTVQTSARTTLSGNDLDNLLKGGGGADQINGGRGADRLGGGAAADVFVFRKGEARGDRVEDLQHGDALHFQGFSAGAALLSRGEGVWSISDRDGVGVIQVAGRTRLAENSDYFFV